MEELHAKITGGFWKKRQQINRVATLGAVYDRFEETGRFAALNCRWEEGMPKPHHFWDSDAAKWLEGAAYLLAEHTDRALYRTGRKIVEAFLAHQTTEGYFNSYYQAMDPTTRFANRDMHELYCAGHWIEAGVAWYNATGETDFLNAVCRFADYIELRFVQRRDTAFFTPGHEELELALIKLYDCTLDPRYLSLALHFLNLRGTVPEEATPEALREKQSHLPVRQQTEAVGHAVRATYLYCAMADAALRTGDEELKAACKALFDDIVTKKIYITGAVGANAARETFSNPYDLPNLITYGETCAGIGMMLFARRMQKLETDSRYADAIETILYNNFSSAVSLDGTAFFYSNPLEILPELEHRRGKGARDLWLPAPVRQAVFSCSCCPPNVVRFIPQLNDMIWSDDGETLYLHQFIPSRVTVTRNGVSVQAELKTRYPENGNLHLSVTGGDLRVAVRVPGWCDGFTGAAEKGYFTLSLQDGKPQTVRFPMPVQLIEARREVTFDCGRYAVRRGPVVYCAEEKDNGKHLRDVIITGKHFQRGEDPEWGFPTLTVAAKRRAQEDDAPLYRPRTHRLESCSLRLIPYYAFGNRGAGEMMLWLRAAEM